MPITKRTSSGPATPRRPESCGGPRGRGLDDNKLRRCEEAVADSAEEIQFSPRDSRTCFERGDVWFEARRYEEAVADYDRTVALDPDNVEAYLRRCQANSELGRHEEALEDYGPGGRSG